MMSVEGGERLEEEDEGESYLELAEKI